MLLYYILAALQTGWYHGSITAFVPVLGRGLYFFVADPASQFYGLENTHLCNGPDLNELREKYLHYFETKGHLRLGSFPLVPKDDPSLLLINSGMAPMKKWFLGQEEPPRHRVTTCQKCIRTPDIERVGITARHGCFFEMLGNFSFQDYFKKEVIPWAWEFLTKELEIPADRLYISVYQEDDEAYDIWTKEVGIPEDHMVRLGKEDNFWEHGSGPCGPCSEIYYDRGLKYGCGKPDLRRRLRLRPLHGDLEPRVQPV